MLAAIFLGTAGHLCAIFLTVAAGGRLAEGLQSVNFPKNLAAGTPVGMGSFGFGVFLIALGVLRGIFYYGEQYCQPYLTFRMLERIRTRVFETLRRRGLEKWDEKEKNILAAEITSDTEQLKELYTHTVSPVATAFLVSLIMSIWMGNQSLAALALAVCSYGIIGGFLPAIMAKAGAEQERLYRLAYEHLNRFVKDSFSGLDETIQYGCQDQRREEMNRQSLLLLRQRRSWKETEAGQRSAIRLFSSLVSVGMLFLMLFLYQRGEIGFVRLLFTVFAIWGSLRPAMVFLECPGALSKPLTAGKKILSFLEEEPGSVLSDVSLEIPKGRITGITGLKEGEETMRLKQFLRCYEESQDKFFIPQKESGISETNSFQRKGVYLSGEIDLFSDTIANNISLGKEDAAMEQVIEVAKKAGIHDAIQRLPDGYQTRWEKLETLLSEGERQRIGLARAFLYNPKLWVLDEPTAGLDTINEGMYLKLLKENTKGKTLLIASQRRQLLQLADQVIELGEKIKKEID